MKTVEHYQWRVLWLGKWVTTRYTTDEATIKATHPEAIRCEGSMVLREQCETEAEVRAAMASHSTPPMGLKKYP